MEDLHFHHTARERAGGSRKMAIVGVVASGNLEVLVERVLADDESNELAPGERAEFIFHLTRAVRQPQQRGDELVGEENGNAAQYGEKPRGRAWLSGSGGK